MEYISTKYFARTYRYICPATGIHMSRILVAMMYIHHWLDTMQCPCDLACFILFLL